MIVNPNLGRLLLASALTFVFLFNPACKKGPKECPPCPNNTQCNDGDCGCKPDQHDMGNWCLNKHDNLFVSGSLECPCLQQQGLYLLDIQPQEGPITGSGKSTYALGQPNNIYSEWPAKFHYYDLPDGDSIAIYNLIGPGAVGFYNCEINDSLVCEIDILGKFYGPDTIQTTVYYRRCRLDLDHFTEDEITRPLTFVRK